MFAPMMQYRDGRPNDPVERRLVQHSVNPFSGLTPDELRRRMEYERNNPDEFRQTIMPVPIRQVGETPRIPGRVFQGPKPVNDMMSRLTMATERRAEPRANMNMGPRPPIGNVMPVSQPFQNQLFQPQPAPPQFGQVQQQPQFNQQGMQQMMQFMQQMMQMFSMMSGQGGFGGGFGGGFNQRPPMFGGGYGGGMGGGFGQGGYQQFQQPQQRPMPNMFGNRGRRQFEMQYGFDGKPIGMGLPTNMRTFM